MKSLYRTGWAGRVVGFGPPTFSPRNLEEAEKSPGRRVNLQRGVHPPPGIVGFHGDGPLKRFSPLSLLWCNSIRCRWWRWNIVWRSGLLPVRLRLLRLSLVSHDKFDKIFFQIYQASKYYIIWKLLYNIYVEYHIYLTNLSINIQKIIDTLTFRP